MRRFVLNFYTLIPLNFYLLFVGTNFLFIYDTCKVNDSGRNLI